MPSPKRAHVWDRDFLDWYIEPEACTDALLRAERFVGHVWDPACGQGNVLRACLRAGMVVSGGDIVERGMRVEVADFLTCLPRQAQNIITNPPFYRAKGTEAFIRRALALASGKVAIFADLKFLAGAGRAKGLFVEQRPHRVWVMYPRPSCPPGTFLADGGTASGGTADWCWLVWSMTEPRAVRTEIGWLDLNGGSPGITTPGVSMQVLGDEP